MSRQLPPKANFDYLKKQAKELRAELSREQPDVQLADAQRLLAREIRIHDLGRSEGTCHRSARTRVGRHLAGEPVKVQQSAANLFRDATLRFSVQGKAVTIADAVVDESGRTDSNSNTLVVDGRAHEQQYGYAVTARWITPRHLQAALTKDGEGRGHVDYRVDSDGRTMTLSTPDSAIVFDRIGG